MNRLFDTVVMVDWSARSKPSPTKPSPDSIWFAVASGSAVAPAFYCRTRAEAFARLADLLATEIAAGRRTLAGFDFPFGYPKGFAAALTGRQDGLAVWDWLAGAIDDQPDNANNRFDVAERINAMFPGDGPFWARPASAPNLGVPIRKSDAAHALPERRLVERLARTAQPCWKLGGAGSVGSQALLGISTVARLRREPRLRGSLQVWPFETGLHAGEAPVVLAEIYPSLLRQDFPSDVIKDKAQVERLAAAMAGLGAAGALGALFEGARALSDTERRVVRTEEAWMLGAGFENHLRAAA